MQITGTLKLVRPTQQVTEKFSKREFVVLTNEQYAQSIQLELQGQNCDIIDSYAEGQEVECSLNLRGRLWVSPQGEEKYFNTIVCWKIQPANLQNQTKPAPQEVYKEPMPVYSQEDADGDSLPF